MLVDYGLPVQVPEQIKLKNGDLISQGAEALVFHLKEDNTVIKFRPSKPWRLPELDKQLRTRRTKQEVKVLQKLKSMEIGVPEVKYVDPQNGVLCMEHIEGTSLKHVTWAHEGKLDDKVRHLYRDLGYAIARMHSLNIMHGDLTTSNVMVDLKGQLRMIDFGLSTQQASVEDKAVDLYVLERAIASTHPLEVKELMDEFIMPAYEKQIERSGLEVEPILKKLEKTRAGGRKRTQNAMG